MATISFNVKHIVNESSSGLELFPRGPIDHKDPIDEDNPNWEYLARNSVKTADHYVKGEDHPFKFLFFSKNKLGKSDIRNFEIFNKENSLRIIDVSLKRDNESTFTVNELHVDMGLIVRDDQVVIVNYKKKLLKDERASLCYKCYLYSDDNPSFSCVAEDTVNGKGLDD